MYTAKVISKTISEFGSLDIKVEVDDGSEGIRTIVFNGITSVDDLENKIRSQISFYKKSTAAIAAIPIGAFEVSEELPPSDPTPTQEEIARGQYIALLGKLDAYKRDIGRGILQEDYQLYLDTLQTVKTLYIPAYSGL